MVGDLTATQVEHMLADNIFGRIGCHAFGRTYVVPITYAYDGNYVYANSDEGMKLHMMRSNPIVCFEVDLVDANANWQSVIASGHFEELHGEQAQAAWQMLVDRIERSVATPPGATVHPHSAATPAIVYRLHLQNKTGRFEKRV
jgi:nitroimidazol reductase NimA-like FMN-containing flavoprotein (pyridoxamine 5'-phosphate oxidase superfamily)